MHVQFNLNSSRYARYASIKANKQSPHKKLNGPADTLNFLIVMKLISSGAALFLSVALVRSTKIVLTNDDGWATAMIRQQMTDLIKAGYDVSRDILFQ